MPQTILFIAQFITYTILAYFVLLNLFYLGFSILALVGFHRYRTETAYVSFKELFNLPLIKPITIIAPAYNEEKNILKSVTSLLSLEYPQYEVVVVNDGSTDKTLQVLIDAFHMKKINRIFKEKIKTKSIRGIYMSPSYPKLLVVDKENGMKADALNTGLNIGRFPLFCAIDCDSLIEKDALLKIVRPFLERPLTTVAAGGVIRLLNGCTIKSGRVTNVMMPHKWIERFQIIEYFRAFLGGRLGLSKINCLLIISGAFGLFRKDVAVACGGYRTNSIGEDMDLVIRMKKYLYDKKIAFDMFFIPDPICWTYAPPTLKHLARQRNRWHIGLIDTLKFNSKMLLNPKYGVTGLLAMPFYFVFEMFGPLIELSGYVIFAVFLVTGRINYPFTWMFFVFAFLIGILLSILAVFIEEFSARRFPRLKDIWIIISASILENFFYRQFLSLIRAKAFLNHLMGKKRW